MASKNGSRTHKARSTPAERTRSAAPAAPPVEMRAERTRATRRPYEESGGWREPFEVAGPNPEAAPSHRPRMRLVDSQRLGFFLGGSALTAVGLARRSVVGAALAVLGAGFMYRGAAGRGRLSQRLRLAHPPGLSSSVRSGRGVRVEQTLLVQRSPQELYRFWRNMENLPRIMRHIQEIKVKDPRQSHWVVTGPGGVRFEWDSLIINEKANELIAWRSLEGADVDSAGSVHFRPAPDGSGTEVRVVLAYDPPGGRAGAALARLFGRDPAREIAADLLQFKETMEAGRSLPPRTGLQPQHAR